MRDRLGKRFGRWPRHGRQRSGRGRWGLRDRHRRDRFRWDRRFRRHRWLRLGRRREASVVPATPAASGCGSGDSASGEAAGDAADLDGLVLGRLVPNDLLAGPLVLERGRSRRHRGCGLRFDRRRVATRPPTATRSAVAGRAPDEHLGATVRDRRAASAARSSPRAARERPGRSASPGRGGPPSPSTRSRAPRAHRRARRP